MLVLGHYEKGVCPTCFRRGRYLGRIQQLSSLEKIGQLSCCMGHKWWEKSNGS